VIGMRDDPTRGLQIDALDNLRPMQIDNQNLSFDMMHYFGFLVGLLSLLTLAFVDPPLIGMENKYYQLDVLYTNLITYSMSDLTP
jgi:hypothetical protein